MIRRVGFAIAHTGLLIAWSNTWGCSDGSSSPAGNAVDAGAIDAAGLIVTPPCTPNAQEDCHCSPGEPGYQVCPADGSKWGRCLCSDASSVFVPGDAAPACSPAVITQTLVGTGTWRMDGSLVETCTGSPSTTLQMNDILVTFSLGPNCTLGAEIAPGCMVYLTATDGGGPTQASSASLAGTQTCTSTNGGTYTTTALTITEQLPASSPASLYVIQQTQSFNADGGTCTLVFNPSCDICTPRTTSCSTF